MRTEQLAFLLENGLNTNDFGIVFDITANFKEYKKSVRSKKRYDNPAEIVYGILRNITSEALAVKDLGYYVISSELELAVPTEKITNVYDILQQYYELMLGQNNELDDYKVGLNFVVPTVGIEDLNVLGGTIPINLTVDFTITKNTITFNDVKFYIDGEEMNGISGWNIDNIKEQEVVNSGSDTIKRNLFKSQGLAISITLVHLSVNWFQKLWNDFYRDRNNTLNKTYTIKYEDALHNGGNALVFKMGIVQMPMSGSPQSPNEVGIVFAEMRDDV